MQISKNIKVVLMFFFACFLSLPQSSNAQSPQEESASCIKSLSDDSELARLKGKVGLSGVTEQTFEMKTNKAYPTALEKKMITLWVGKVRKCSEILEKAANEGQVHPSMVPIINGLYPRFEQRAIQLYDKKISYGEFARARDEDYSAFLREVERIKQDIARQQEESRQREEQRRQAQRQAWQEQERNAANEKAARCQIARQNAATFCNQGNRGVVVNVGPDSYSNTNGQTIGGAYMDSYNCSQWSIKASQDCQ